MRVPWPSWEQATAAGLLSLLLAAAADRTRAGERWRPAFAELALICGLYAVWRLARLLPLTHEGGAVDRARAIDDLQGALNLPSEAGLNRWVADHDALAWLVNAYYAVMHVPALLVFLVWLFWRHRDAYPHWRNGLVAVTAACLAIRFVRVAPPRLLPELDVVDLSSRHGFDVYGPVGTGVSDQFAAMPSIHVGWAAVVALGAFAVARSRWRWVVLLHLPVTVLVVAATAHHWWADGAVAVAFLVAGLRIDRRLRAVGARSSQIAARRLRVAGTVCACGRAGGRRSSSPSSPCWPPPSWWP